MLLVAVQRGHQLAKLNKRIHIPRHLINTVPILEGPVLYDMITVRLERHRQIEPVVQIGQIEAIRAKRMRLRLDRHKRPDLSRVAFIDTSVGHDAQIARVHHHGVAGLVRQRFGAAKREASLLRATLERLLAQLGKLPRLGAELGRPELNGFQTALVNFFRRVFTSEKRIIE